MRHAVSSMDDITRFGGEQGFDLDCFSSSSDTCEAFALATAAAGVSRWPLCSARVEVTGSDKRIAADNITDRFMSYLLSDLLSQLGAWLECAHFIAVSVSVMRRILIDHARRKRALKRSADQHAGAEADDYAGFSCEEADELIALNVALDQLQEMSPRHRHVVESRCFGGLSVEETADVLNVSPGTVKRDWATARLG
jgi:RNA polymerase sigma factor (sigma-70 family)